MCLLKRTKKSMFLTMPILLSIISLPISHLSSSIHCSPDTFVLSFFKFCDNYSFFNFYILVGLQCSINFYCIAKWPSHNTHSFSHTTLHHIPSQVTRYSSLCYTAGSHCLSTTNASVHLLTLKLPVHPTPYPSPLATTNLFSKFMSFFSVERFICDMY